MFTLTNQQEMYHSVKNGVQRFNLQLWEQEMVSTIKTYPTSNDTREKIGSIHMGNCKYTPT